MTCSSPRQQLDSQSLPVHLLWLQLLNSIVRIVRIVKSFSLQYHGWPLENLYIQVSYYIHDMHRFAFHCLSKQPLSSHTPTPAIILVPFELWPWSCNRRDSITGKFWTTRERHIRNASFWLFLSNSPQSIVFRCCFRCVRTSSYFMHTKPFFGGGADSRPCKIAGDWVLECRSNHHSELVMGGRQQSSAGVTSWTSHQLMITSFTVKLWVIQLLSEVAEEINQVLWTVSWWVFHSWRSWVDWFEQIQSVQDPKCNVLMLLMPTFGLFSAHLLNDYSFGPFLSLPLLRFVLKADDIYYMASLFPAGASILFFTQFIIFHLRTVFLFFPV